MPLPAYTNYAMGPPQVSFSFRVDPPTVLFLYVWCLLWCMLSGAILDAVFTYGSLTIDVCIVAALWSFSMAGICATW